MKLWIDCETRSPIPLNTAGTVKYATQAEVLTVQWAVDDGPVQLWVALGEYAAPTALLAAIESADSIWAHNAFFDRTILMAQPWWPRAVGLDKWRCVMAQALSHGLPGGLDKLCDIFNVQEAKHSGKELIRLFCVPRTDGEWNGAHTHPKEWAAFLEYAKADVPSMREVSQKCPKWNYAGGVAGERELALWHLDQTINDRGFAVDVEFAQAAVRATNAEKRRFAKRTADITYGEVERTTQRDRLLAHLLLEYGVELPDLRGDTIERRLGDPELPEYVKELLRIRLQASKASTSKYQRLLQMEVGGRICGSLQFNGANRTGRWGGRGFQPQNLPRPAHKFPLIEAGIAAFKAECEVEVVEDIMGLASSALRSTIVAGPGKRLCVSDLSNIEGRMTAWLADEEWKLDAFRAFDAGEGPDLYKVAYGRSFGVNPHTVGDDCPERQIGKVQELSLGYQGGVGAYATMATTYHVDLEDMAVKARAAVPQSVYTDAQRVWVWAEQQKRTLGLSKDVYVICEALKSLWRAAHPAIVTMWSAYEVAATQAILNPGPSFPVGRVAFDRYKSWLRMRLPSGRYLCYPMPQVSGGKISYMGVNAYNRQWHRISTYGGKLVENAVQAASRDIIADAMPRVEAAGYSIVLTCHDEIMAEVPDSSELDEKRLNAILATPPSWADGIPLAAKGFTTYRYKKG